MLNINRSYNSLEDLISDFKKIIKWEKRNNFRNIQGKRLADVYMAGTQANVHTDEDMEKIDCLFDDFTPETKKVLKLEYFREVIIYRSAISRYYACRVGENKAINGAKVIKKTLRGREMLLWLYGAALVEYTDQRRAIGYYDDHENRHKNMKKILNEFNAGIIDTLELSRRISSVRPIYAARPKDLEELRKIYNKRWGKDWRKPSPVFSDAICKAIAFVHKENKKREEEKRGLVESKLTDAIEEVRKHLKLFGIEVKDIRKLQNLLYHNPRISWPLELLSLEI